MLTRLPCKVFVGTLTTALLYAGPAAGQYSSVTDLGHLGGGASVASSINFRSQVVGASLREDSTQGGFIWQDGVVTDLGSLGGTATVAYAINARGQVVGGSNRAEDSSVGAFVWHEGVMTELPRLGGNHAAAVGINARGQIVGQSQTADGGYRAVMWENGAITDLGTLGGDDGAAYSVNARGVACGFSALASGEHRAALYAEGDIVNLGTLGGSLSQCLLGTNNRGQFVGSSTIAGDVESHAFVTVDGVMTDLNPQIPADSGWLLEYAYGINERGQIVGAGHRRF